MVVVVEVTVAEVDPAPPPVRARVLETRTNTPPTCSSPANEVNWKLRRAGRALGL
jgi:hypothetical protein